MKEQEYKDNFMTILHHLYPNLMDVMEIFQWYFGVDNVDFTLMENSMEQLCDTFCKNNIGKFIPSECSQPFKEAMESLPDSDIEEITGHLMAELTGENSSRRYFKILVRFPHITVTNEHNQSTDIDNLFARIFVDTDGKCKGYFTLNRTTYSLLHILNRYMHSHVSGINYDFPEKFKDPCLGSGPIQHTLESLIIDYNGALWKLFCYELDKYVRVESLTGIPYKYLGKLSYRKSVKQYELKSYQLLCSGIPITVSFADYMTYFSDHQLDMRELMLKIAGIDNLFVIGDRKFIIGKSPKELLLLTTEILKDFINNSNAGVTLDELVECRIVAKGTLGTDTLSCEGTVEGVNAVRELIGTPILDFKGESIKLEVPDIDRSLSEAVGGELYFIHPIFMWHLLNNILFLLNLQLDADVLKRNIQHATMPIKLYL